MKNRFNLVQQFLANPWHMHQASAMGLMPIVVQLVSGQFKSEWDEELIIPEGMKPSAQRAISQYQKFSSEAYVSERDTWYYEDFPIKLAGGVLMIPVVGAIFPDDYYGTAGTRTIASWYAKALQDPEIKVVLERKNTPGGAVFGTRDLANKKIVFKQSKPIVGLAEGMECSAGLYLGAADNYKIVAPDSIIGSCGVMTTFADWSGWYEEFGVVVKDLYSKTSPLKNDAYRRAMKGDFKGYTDGILFKLDQSFMTFMEEQRPNISKTALQGADYVAEEGIENGLADALGSFDDAYEKALEYAKNPSLASKQKSKNTMSKVKMYVPAAAAALLRAFGATEVEDNTQEQEETTETQDEPEETEEKPEAATQTPAPAAAATKPTITPEAKQIAELTAQLAKEKSDFAAFKAAAGQTNPAAQRSNARQEGKDKAPVVEETKNDGKMANEDAFKARHRAK